MSLQTKQVRRILVCQLRQIGDVLLATPAVEMLAKHFPEAKIDFFTEKKCASLLLHNPNISQIWQLDKAQLPTLLHELAFYRKIARSGYDLVVDFQQLPRIRWVVAFSRAPLRLSFPPPWYLRFLYTHWHQPEQNYAAVFKAGVLTPLGITWQGERPSLYLTEAERQEATHMLAQLNIVQQPDDFFITLDPTHRHSTRRWPKEHYARLIDLLANANQNIRFLLLYGPDELRHVQKIKKACVHQDRVFISSTMFTLRQAAACMEHAAMHVGNCSAPRHIAVSVGLPSVAILGSTSVGWTYPAPEHTHIKKGLPCQSCRKNTCPNNTLDCLNTLLPDEVAPKVLSHLYAHGKYPGRTDVETSSPA